MSARTPAIGTVLRLSKAHLLIRQGQLKAARAMVSPDGRPPEDDTELHTLAALTTHEGDYGQALSLWKLLLQRQPRHVEATRMIAAIEVWQGRPDWHRYVPMGAALAAVLVIGVVLLAVFSGGDAKPQTARPAPIAAPAAAPIGAAARPAAPTAAPTATPGIQFPVRTEPKKKTSNGR